MPAYKITSTYAGLSVSKVVTADDEDDAFTMTGIGTELEALGYTIEPGYESDYEVDNLNDVLASRWSVAP